MSRPDHRRRVGTAIAIRRSLLIGLFALVSLAGAFWLVAFFGTLIADPGEIDSDAVVGFIVLQVILAAFWFPLFRAVRRRRPRRRDQRRYFPRAQYRPSPLGRHELGVNLGIPRMAKADLVFRDDGPPERLARAEQALGNALYQLDLRREDHQLTREQISVLRVTGIDASAWLTGRTGRHVNDGIKRFADLAQATENFLVGKASAADLDKAKDRLVQLTTRHWRGPAPQG